MFKHLNTQLPVFLFIHSLERKCQWRPVWRLSQSVTQTSQQTAPSSIPPYLETKTQLLLSGVATRIIHRQDEKTTCKFIFFSRLIL